MPWLLLLRSPLAWAGLALAAVSIYAAVQHFGWASCKASAAQFRAEVASAAAEAEVQAAQEGRRQAQNAAEVLGDLQTRYSALDARYRVLRADAGGGRPMPSLPATPGSPSACPRDSGESDADARCLVVLEKADRELAKFRELWELQKKNAAQ